MCKRILCTRQMLWWRNLCCLRMLLLQKRSCGTTPPSRSYVAILHQIAACSTVLFKKPRRKASLFASTIQRSWRIRLTMPEKAFLTHILISFCESSQRVACLQPSTFALENIRPETGITMVWQHQSILISLLQFVGEFSFRLINYTSS